MYTVLDIECTYQGKFGSVNSDASPFNPRNKLVSVGYKTNTGEQDYFVINHKEHKSSSHELKLLQDVLNRSDMVIGHNLKFDLMWLFEAGLRYSGKLWDTMIFEYVNGRGLKVPLSLKDTLKRYELTCKLDILELYCGQQGLNVDEVPLAELIEYGEADINTTYELFEAQKALVKSDKDIKTMIPAIKLMNDFLEVLVDVERNGINIDMNALDEVGDEFRARKRVLEEELQATIINVMGHTPINLDSPEQVSWVLHSVKVKDKKEWANIFNLGTEERNGVSKKRYPKKYDLNTFREYIYSNTEKLYKTTAKQCKDCKGKGYIQKYNKDGQPSKRLNVCHTCEKTGLLYVDTDEVAGFKIHPISSLYTAVGGFSTSKTTLDLLLLTELSKEAREFIEKLKEYNAISSYLSSFVEGIRNNVHGTVLHTNFNQCITATGRLSSSRPNLQNQPRSGTFPIRRVFVSSFDGGNLLNADFSQLEFRVAAFLANCEAAKKDIKESVDVHNQTAQWITEAGQDMSRQEAKIRTFRPLYGGTQGTKAEKAYYEMFFKKYKGIFEWHKELLDFALENKYIQTPSGRIYAFPHVKRLEYGGVTYHTQIKNYPVQGYATGDILPVTMTELYRLMKKARAKSKLVLTVHDSIVADVHPDENEVMIQLFKEAFANTLPLIKERFGVEFDVPLDFELEIGPNLLEKTEIIT